MKHQFKGDVPLVRNDTNIYSLKCINISTKCKLTLETMKFDV